MSSALQREVGRRQIEAGEARTAVVRTVLAAHIEKVWAALTSPDGIGAWFLPVMGELRAGGAFAIENNAHGRIVACEPTRRFHVTWEYGERPVDELEVLLTAVPEGTALELIHATVTATVEWEGAQVDPLPDVGANWEVAATVGLPAYLAGRGRPADAKVDVAYERIIGAWTALVAADAG